MSGLAGLDVSSWQHPEGAEIDWEAVWQDGYRFVVVKATQGVGYVNPWAKRDLSDARAQGFLLGAYHYLVVGEDPVRQAELFIETLGGERIEVSTWCDFEPSGPVQGEPQQALQTFTAKVHETRPFMGLYASAEVVDELRAGYVPLGRIWLAWHPLGEIKGTPYMVQGEAVEIPGIEGGPVDVDLLTSTRGIDLPTAPRPRPSERPAEVQAVAPAPEVPAPAPPEAVGAVQ